MALSDTLPTFSLAWILETLAEDEGLTCGIDGIDDVCFGYVISSDKSFAQACAELKGVYDFRFNDGDPIQIVRRAVNDDLSIDLVINQADCIRRGSSPAISFSRVDPAALPRQVEIFYIDPDRDYAVTSQVARHTSAPTTNAQISITLPLVLSATQAKNLAFDMLYRIWSQQLTLGFEHKDTRIQNGDVLQVVADQGTYICIVDLVTYNAKTRTAAVQASALLTSKGATVSAPTADPFDRDTGGATADNDPFLLLLE